MVLETSEGKDSASLNSRQLFCLSFCPSSHSHPRVCGHQEDGSSFLCVCLCVCVCADDETWRRVRSESSRSQSRIMGSRVHFKLKNALEKQSVTFDGAVIQVGDIKRLIAEQLGTW